MKVDFFIRFPTFPQLINNSLSFFFWFRDFTTLSRSYFSFMNSSFALCSYSLFSKDFLYKQLSFGLILLFLDVTFGILQFLRHLHTHSSGASFVFLFLFLHSCLFFWSCSFSFLSIKDVTGKLLFSFLFPKPYFYISFLPTTFFVSMGLYVVNSLFSTKFSFLWTSSFHWSFPCLVRS